MSFLLALNAGVQGGATTLSQLTAAKDFARFLEVNMMTFSHEAGIAWLLLEAAATALGDDVAVPRVTNDVANMTCKLVPAQGAAANAPVAYFDAAGGNDQNLAEGIPVAQFRIIVGDRQKAIYWLLNLAACHQVKPLKASNVMNYFRMTSRINVTGREIMKVLEFAALSLPRIMGNADLQAMMEQNQFITYHTSYSSTATLAHEMIDSAPGLTSLLFSQATRDAISESHMNLHNSTLNAAISQQAVLATHAYLTVFNKLPDGWFQGERAKATLPASRYAAYTAIFRKVKSLNSGIVNIEAADDMAALANALGADLQGV
jgi:hypothetical protein